MVTQEVPNKLHTILNGSDSNPLRDWIKSEGGAFQLVEDALLKRFVVSLDSTKDNCGTCIVREFGPDDPIAKLPNLSLLVRTLPKQHFNCCIKMSVQPCDEPSEVRKIAFMLTTEKSKVTSNNMKQDTLKPGWNFLVLRLAEICSTMYNSQYLCTTKITVHSTCRLYRVYFSDRLYNNEELPEGYRLSPYDSPELYTVAE